MRRVGVEETTAVTTQQLDRFLGSDGPACQDLLNAFEGRHADRRPERLRYTLPNEKQRADRGYWKQEVERYSGQVDPEIADGRRTTAGETAHQRKRDGDTGGAGEE